MVRQHNTEERISFGTTIVVVQLPIETLFGKTKIQEVGAI